MDDDATLAFRSLDPNRLLDAIDAGGWQTDGRVTALNSYENRVYAVGLADGDTVVAKFYRPGRWTDAAIGEEHAFCHELQSRELPAVAPLKSDLGESLLQSGPYRFCLFPRVGGRPPELDNPAQLTVIGRTLARMHLVGDIFPFKHRPEISIERFGDEAVDFLQQSSLLPATHTAVYATLVDELLPAIEDGFDRAGEPDWLSLHGDVHPGNLLWSPDGRPQLVDFDDCASGPAIQDLWMFLSGDRHYAQARLGDLLDGYHEFREFDLRELALIEPLRTLRIIHYAAWIAQRWDDPAFRQAFPFFGSERFWDEHILSLREQQAALDEPALRY